MAEPLEAIVYDEPKRRTNLEKHGYDFAAVGIGFFAEATVVPSYGGRFLAIGRFGGATLAIAFRPVGNQAVAIMSMRPASRKERKLHEEDESAAPDR